MVGIVYCTQCEYYQDEDISRPTQPKGATTSKSFFSHILHLMKREVNLIFQKMMPLPSKSVRVNGIRLMCKNQGTYVGANLKHIQNCNFVKVHFFHADFFLML